MRIARKANSRGINKKKLQELPQHMFSALNYLKAFVQRYRKIVLPRDKLLIALCTRAHKEVDGIGYKRSVCKTVEG